ncbi:leukocyte receptor cluster member 9 isoform X3 [Girardinichthys multiradiatus]|uniref:leukocyte receptor cluster member 9 isoform X3 n=1 Tax=Girardinichthys multiradiatus TaxID=208333 RepID=UPI001FACD4D0|nr:leukocyte receptor cluster member 9 isoform X3 [Girardinichthys multiradiatus]
MASECPSVSLDSMENQRDGGGSLLKPTALTDSPDPNAWSRTDRSNDTRKAAGASAQQNTDELKVCHFFRLGKCHFGGRCRLSHSDPSPHDSAFPSPDMDDKQDGEKMEKHKKKKPTVNKVAKPRDNEGKADVNKKPRMRTADEVISRILWDTSVDASEFVVGYVDRFLGVLERPFCDFNWDTNPCDCDYSTELALPRHRIQYFAYRGHRVWDRHSRTDRVFGSTGQSLAPPFGKEEDVKENDTEDQEQQQDIGSETTEEQTRTVCGQDEGETEDCSHTKNRHVEEDGLNEMIHTFASKHCGGNTSQEQQESHGSCVAEEAANRLEPSTEHNSSFQEHYGCEDVREEGEDRHYEKWEETLEGNEDTQNSPLKQVEEKCDGRPPKKQPTHFISFPANTPAILSCFQQLQEELTALLPSSAPHWQTTSKLHVTLCLLVLRSPAEVAAAAEILRQFAHLDRNPPVAVTFPVKLKHFNGKVLYLSPQPQLHLHQLNCGLQEAFRKEGWLHRSSYNPRYHLTLAKVEYREGERIFEGVGDLKVGRGLNFGRLPVNTLHLCSVGGSEVNGFYEIVCTVTLR